MDTTESTRERNIPDQSWKSLYKAGGISGVLVGILLIIAIVLISITPQAPTSGGIATLEYIASNRLVYIVGQVVGIAPVFLEIVVFLALLMALKGFNKSAAAIGSVLAIVSQAVVLASVNFGGLVNLSDNYMVAVTDAQRAVFANAAEWAIAFNNSVSASGIDVIMTSGAIGVLILSFLMLKGVFQKGIAVLGIIAGVLGIISAFGVFISPLPVTPQLGIGYTLYAFILTIWLVAVGIKLYKLGRD